MPSEAKRSWPQRYWPFLVTGAALGVGAVVLSSYGNPRNTGICISCFMENVAGAIGLHDNIRMQYLRPEIPGFVLGSFFLALYRGKFVPTGGSSPLLRFFIGILLMIGCAVFIGCPVKVLLRLAAGDLSALAGLAGMVGGVYLGLEFIENGFRLGEARETPLASGFVLPGIMLLLLLLGLVQPFFIAESVKGAAARHAPYLMSLSAGLIIGAVAHYSQFCITGGVARIFLWGPREIVNCPRSTGLLIGIASFFSLAFIASLLTGQFQFGLHGQPSSNESYGWAFLGMLLVGFGSVLIRGCPLRQLVASGQGDSDAGAAVLGMLVGAALVQNWHLGGTSEGTPFAARIAVLLGIGFLLVIGLLNRRRGYGVAPEFQVGLD